MDSKNCKHPKKLQLMIFAFIFLSPYAESSSELNEIRKEIKLLEEKIIKLEAEQAKEKSLSTKNSIPKKSQSSSENFVKDYSFGGYIQNDFSVYGNALHGKYGADVRNARLSLSGKIDKNWNYKLEYNFAPNITQRVNNVYIDYKVSKSAFLRLGYFAPFFGLEGATSTKDQIFIENSPIWVFYPPHRTGALFSINGDNWSFSNGITVGNKKLENKKFSMASNSIFSRSTYSFSYNNSNLFHFGGSVYFTNYPNKFGSVNYKARPENRFFEPIISTNDINLIRNSKSIALDLAWKKGPFLLQGEYVLNHLDRSSPYPSIGMDGFYLQTAFILTGEERSYNKKSGYFGGIQPKDSYNFSNGTGTGAWETAFRYSNLNLNSRSLRGGEMSSYNFAINWYPTTSIRLMNNLIYSSSKRYIFSRENKEISYILRLQFIF